MRTRDKLVISDREMYNRIDNAVWESNKRYTHIVLDKFPSIRAFDEAVIMGSFSWTLTHSRQRLIHSSKAVYLPSGVCTPSDLARHYLAEKFPHGVRCKTVQYRAFSKGCSHPLYAQPCVLDYGAYVDIKAAYWNILRVVGWNVEYMPTIDGKRGFLGVGQSMNDWPFPEHKLARNCLVSLGVGKGMRIYHNGKFETKNVGNKHRNRGLWHLAMDVLNSIAYDCVNAGAVYVHTDGFIFPIDKLDAGMNAIEAWGLPARIKHMGQSRVWGTGAYDIGSHYHKSKAISRHTFRSIRPVEDIDWLRHKFGFFARRVIEPEVFEPQLTEDEIVRYRLMMQGE